MEVFAIQTSKTGFYSRGRKYLLRGTNWTFKLNGLNYVLNWLKEHYGDPARPNGCVFLRSVSGAAHLLGMRVRGPTTGMDISLSSLFCQVSLRDEPINRQGESYRLWCVVVCHLETSKLGKSWPNSVLSDIRKKKENYFDIFCMRTVI